MTTSLDDRLAALAEAVEAADRRLDDELVAQARAVVVKAGARLGLGVESTVVALAGPTGAGKSSLFNALVGDEIARVGRRRPTTSVSAAAVWGEANPALLDWLGVQRRHRIDQDGPFEGLVLVDLPDLDSVERAHWDEVDRLVELVDLVVWVADPQKYADSSWHDGYLRRLASHAEAMAVVLNQVDLMPAPAAEETRADLERLLREDGLDGVPVLAGSARTGDGIAQLRRLLGERVAGREAAVARLGADVTAAAAALAGACGPAREPRMGRAARAELVDALADAAGAPTVVDAVQRSHRRRGRLATGWPFVRWLTRLRPDPLRRLHLAEPSEEAIRTSLPAPSPGDVARVENVARRIAAETVHGLPQPWPRLVREAALPARDELVDALDRAVAGTDLVVRAPRWWRVAGFLQALFALAAATGAAWLLALVGFAFLRIEEVVPLPEIRSVPVPTVLLLGGAGAGILLALVTRLVNGTSARRRGRIAARAIRERVEAVGDELILEPLTRELDAHNRLARTVAAAGPGAEARR